MLRDGMSLQIEFRLEYDELFLKTSRMRAQEMEGFVVRFLSTLICSACAPEVFPEVSTYEPVVVTVILMTNPMSYTNETLFVTISTMCIESIGIVESNTAEIARHMLTLFVLDQLLSRVKSVLMGEDFLERTAEVTQGGSMLCMSVPLEITPS